LLLCRTDPQAPKHAGLTYFIVDMQAPGVDVRPLRQATGDAEFNEVFLDDVRIPDTARLGPVGAGWKVALTTLMNERTSIGGQIVPRDSGPISDALDIWHTRPAAQGAEERSRLVQLWMRAEVLRLLNVRAGAAARSGNPGPEGSIAKLMHAELNQDVYELCVDLLGPEGALLERRDYDPDDRRRERLPDVRHQFLRSRANTIEGGTSEVMRNILGERMLGLPPEHRVDKDIPWARVPR
jgi:alkylation response protein AidB-like acyl-CoA dehydrogenase